MERAARLFAIRVLLLHALAFVLLLLFTGIGVRNAYRRAQEQAVEQAGLRQQLVAQQTARAIESYFNAVRDNIRLLTRSELQELRPILTPPPPGERGIGALRDQLRDRLDLPPTSRPADRPLHDIGLRNEVVAERMFASAVHKAVWKQIESRASHLIALRTDDDSIIDSEQSDGVPAAAKLFPAILKTIEDGGDEGASDRLEVDGFAYSFIWVRFSHSDPLVVAAVIPLDRLGQQLIDPLNNAAGEVGASLHDSQTIVVRAMDPAMIGVNLEKETTTRGFRNLVAVQRARPMGGVEQIENVEFAKGQMIERGVVAFEPVRLAPNCVWLVAISSSLANVGGLVNEIFAGTLFWAPILLLVFTSVMVSTAVTLIRSRSRMERFRHQLLSRELLQARQIQLSWLPKTSFAGRGLEVAAMNTPASHVSGDFYNYFPLPDGREVVVIGDVTGHGLAAAFLMATTQMLIRATLLRTADARATLNEVNHELCGQAFSGQFVTLLLVVIDQEAGSIDVINAGHPPPILIDDGKAELLKTKPQLVLGVEGDIDYYVQTFDLPGECTILLYTDGIVECRAPSGERFSMDALCASLDGATEVPSELMKRVLTTVDAFRKTEPLTDDATAVAMRISNVRATSGPNFVGARV